MEWPQGKLLLLPTFLRILFYTTAYMHPSDYEKERKVLGGK